MSDNERAGECKLALGEIEVWVVSPPALSDAALAGCLALLADEERARIARFHFERHRREATASRALVRTTVAHYIDRPASSFRYRLGPYGRPYLDPPCGLFFNSTNHPGLVACGVSLDEEIGVDVEPLARGDEILEVAHTVFSEPELKALYALADEPRRDRAVSLWTCKEAYIKARGLGLSAPLRDIAVEFPVGARPTIRFFAGVDVPDGWWIETRDVGGFRVAVATRTAAPNVTLVVRDACELPDVLPSRTSFDDLDDE